LAKYAIIGGTGVYRLDGHMREQRVETSYGDVTVFIRQAGDNEIAFLPRHGIGHSVPPHCINYRANIKALEQLGVKKILATGAVGSLNYDFPPGSLVLMNQFIDFTRQRPHTFYDREDGVVHVDMANPYCTALSDAVEQAARRARIDIAGRGTYICVEGPRFETRAEIAFYRFIGGDMVGMTNVPEVVLAGELGMCYCAVGIVTNWCNGMVDSPISHSEILDIMKRSRFLLLDLFIDVFNNRPVVQECGCSKRLIRM
jgi:5'-methylthioadenosine phosphorylase